MKSVEEIARRWASSTKQTFNSKSAADRITFLKGFKLSGALFAGLDASGHINAYHDLVDYDEKLKTFRILTLAKPIRADSLYLLADGRAVFNEFTAKVMSDRAQAERNEWASRLNAQSRETFEFNHLFAIQMVRWIIRHDASPAIGGQVEAIEFSKNGDSLDRPMSVTK